MQLPPRVHVKHGAYHYDLGRDANGKRSWKKLCRIDDGEHTLYKALAELKKPRARTLGDGFDAFLGSTDFMKLAPRTQKDYFFYINGSDGTGKLRKVFQNAEPDTVKPGHIAQYLYNREQSDAGATGNKEIACLSSVYNYLQRTGQYDGANPCKGVRRNKVRPRTVYPDHKSFLEVFEKAPPAFQDFLAGLYLTGLRQIDLRRLKKTQLEKRRENNKDIYLIKLQETKRSKLIHIEITDTLAEVIRRAHERSPESPFVFTNTHGEPWSYWAIQSQVKRLKAQLHYDWTLHDVRAKSESDSEHGLGLLPLYRRARRVKALG